MADYIKQVMTADGPKQIDYTALANLPVIDDTVKVDSTNAVQGGAVYTELAKKLDASDGKAADSILFDGKTSDYFVSNEDLQQFAQDMGLVVDDDTNAIESLGKVLEQKLDANAQAVDSAKLGEKEPSYYATKEEVDHAQDTADNAMPKAGGKFTGDVVFMVEGKEVWLSFTDEDGEVTDEPYIHWYVEEEEPTEEE